MTDLVDFSHGGGVQCRGATRPPIISLFSGVAGLDIAVEAVTGGRVVAHCEIDPAASKVLAARFPDVPNLGDATQVDWAPYVGTVDVVAAGFSCQDISHAGRRAGITETVTIPAGVMACGCQWADHDMSLCEAASPSGVVPSRVMPVGDPDPSDADLAAARAAVAELNERDRQEWDGPPPERAIEGTRSGVTWSETVRAVRALRPRLVALENVAAILTGGLDVVAADLAAVGYDVRWTCVRASVVGAPHRRDRWFAVAYPNGSGCEAARCACEGREPDVAARRTAAADAGSDGRARGAEPHVGPVGPGQRPSRRGDAERLDTAAADADGAGPQGHRRPVGHAREQHPPPHHQPAWGEYGPAIARWERIIGRPAPPPTDDRGRLDPPFVEWMMGLPDGWTDVDGVSRTGRLRALGNAVVPRQAAAAYRMLLASMRDEVAA